MAPKKKKEIPSETPSAETKVVAAAGVAAGGGGNMSQVLEAAMRKALLDIQHEGEEIWANTKLKEEDKFAKLVELNKPENMRARMLEYREKALAELAAASAQ